MKKLLVMMLIFVALMGFGGPAQAAPTTPVVLAHDCCNGTAANMADIANALAQQGYTVYNLQLPSGYDATVNAQYIKNFIDNNHLASVDLVSFSMGGLSTRYYLKSLTHVNVPVLVEIDTPNPGDFWGCFVSASMCANGSFIKGLNAGDDTPGSTLYVELLNTQGNQYVLDGGVCKGTVTGAHQDLPHQPATIAKVVQAIGGTCPGVMTNLPIK